MLSLFNSILVNCCVNPIIENMDASQQNQNANIDLFIRTCCDMFNEKRFLCYLEENYNLSEHVELIFQVASENM